MVRPDSDHASVPSDLRRWIPVAVWTLIVATLLAIPLKIVGEGYLPADDALRHAAKAVSGKSWGEILVLRDDMTIDQHAGWHALLGWMHRALALDPAQLVGIATVCLFWLFGLSALPRLRRPEAWITALLALNVASVNVSYRLHSGRPLVFSMAVLVVLLWTWSRVAADRPARWSVLVLTTSLVALAAWIHGSWYLWALPGGGFVLARRWRHAVQWVACVGSGVLVAAMLTGSPLAYLVQQLRHLRLSLGEGSVQRFLVTEFQPGDGDFAVVVVVVLAVLLRSTFGSPLRGRLDQPAFWLAALTWVLGFKVSRIWSDWGIPATLVWITTQLDELWEERAPGAGGLRPVVAGLACLALFFSATADLQGRWSDELRADFLKAEDPELAGWFPDNGGILYNSGMQDFYRAFFANPNGPWRYAVGFEPMLMPPEDLAIFREIQWNRYEPAAYAPWIDKMRPEDRLIVRGAPGAAPPIPRLEWRYVADETWIGRPHPPARPTD